MSRSLLNCTFDCIVWMTENVLIKIELLAFTNIQRGEAKKHSCVSNRSSHAYDYQRRRDARATAASGRRRAWPIIGGRGRARRLRSLLGVLVAAETEALRGGRAEPLELVEIALPGVLKVLKIEHGRGDGTSVHWQLSTCNARRMSATRLRAPEQIDQANFCQ